MKQQIACVVLLLSGLPAQRSTSGRQERHARSVTIQRDAFGVPHVHGETDADAVFGYMYARAEDEFYRIEQSCYAAIRSKAGRRNTGQHAEARLRTLTPV